MLFTDVATASEQFIDQSRFFRGDCGSDTLPDRLLKSHWLIETYIKCVGRRPPSKGLYLLAEYLMRDYTGARNKPNVEYPHLTHWQIERRLSKEESLVE
jgi:hypothetical protein